tara:strand:+ start:4362 stop:4739 length:378 start_codon:yes stop_codon:yes gene_type:complete
MANFIKPLKFQISMYNAIVHETSYRLPYSGVTSTVVVPESNLVVSRRKTPDEDKVSIWNTQVHRIGWEETLDDIDTTDKIVMPIAADRLVRSFQEYQVARMQRRDAIKQINQLAKDVNFFMSALL